MMHKEKRKRLEWFLNFMNLDLDQMPPREKYNLFVDLLAVSRGFNPEEEYPRFTVDEDAKSILLSLKWGDTYRLQKRLKEFFESIMQKINTLQNYHGMWQPLKDFEQLAWLTKVETTQSIEIGVNIWKATNGKIEAKTQQLTIADDEDGLIEEDASADRRLVREIVAWAKDVRQKYGDGSNLFRFDQVALKNSPIIISAFSPSNDEQSLISQLIQALDGVPLGALCRCPECDNWFLHISKHNREFCSNKCAARMNSRGRREKLKKEKPKAYEQELKDGAQRARKSYEKKVKETYPRAKVERRPRKYE
jgi:hypothetical protein